MRKKLIKLLIYLPIFNAFCGFRWSIRLLLFYYQSGPVCVTCYSCCFSINKIESKPAITTSKARKELVLEPDLQISKHVSSATSFLTFFVSFFCFSLVQYLCNNASGFYNEVTEVGNIWAAQRYLPKAAIYRNNQEATEIPIPIRQNNYFYLLF